ncbi:MAG TPA: apolipoprotein N-acyltransferase [Rhodopila sp.]|uniref:apolipoprotein N-acyltransferase n=1 Tax=Rhodopila sp. TaxID=2480087 RepID=UPI002D15F217|nr:apolipoprotein N-acyltransferase [Rhodopila sp.]HVY17063.1 apolipoprotein N-acyltransferase [Rhodopila sp.]
MRGWRADLSAMLAGMLAAAALPPITAVPVLAISIPVLLTLINAASTPWVAARRGFFFGFGLNLLGLYWITDAILFEAARFWWLVPLAVPALAAVLAAFIAAPAGVARLFRPGWPAAFALAGAWGLADLARQFVATGFPWNPLGSVWEFPGYAGDVMIQLASLVGVHGMTVATLLLAAAPLLSWRWRGAAAVALLAWIGFGVLRLEGPAPPAPGLKVLLIQGNIAQGQKWDRTLMVSIFRHYLTLTRQAVAAADGKPAVVVWPETASPALLQTDAEARRLISEATGGNQALIGSVRFDREDHPRNSLFALGPSGTVEAIYDKWHLVPFGEYQPDWLPLGIQVVPGGGFAAGPGPKTLHVPGLPPVGALICYEAIFPGEVVASGDRPDWMINVTNDAWFGNSSGPRQHLAAVRLRAVEEGLPMMRAANTGISAAFDAYGHEIERLGLRKTGFLAVNLPGSLNSTLFSRYGLLLPALLCAVVLLAAVRGARAGGERP